MNHLSIKPHNDKCFVRNLYAVSILELLNQKVNALVKCVTKIYNYTLTNVSCGIPIQA